MPSTTSGDKAALWLSLLQNRSGLGDTLPSPHAVTFKTLWASCKIMLNMETQSDWQQLLVGRCFVPFRPHCDLVFLAFSSPSCTAFHGPWAQAPPRAPALPQLPSCSCVASYTWKVICHLILFIPRQGFMGSLRVFKL